MTKGKGTKGQEEFEDTKGAIRNNDLQNIHIKLKIEPY
jgi:hypothetical protein